MRRLLVVLYGVSVKFGPDSSLYNPYKTYYKNKNVGTKDVKKAVPNVLHALRKTG